MPTHALTLTVLDILAEQPVELVPVTLYTVVTEGEMANVELVAPVLHEYVAAPVTTSEVLLFAQMLTKAGVTVICGAARTLMVFVAGTDEPVLLEETKPIVKTPGELNTNVGFCTEATLGEAPAAVHVQVLGALVDKSLTMTCLPEQT